MDFDGTNLSVVQTFNCGSAEGVAVNSGGTQAVTSDPFANTLYLWDLTPSPTGPPILIGGPIPAGVVGPEEVAISPDGTFGIVSGTLDGAISRFEISPVFTVSQTRLGEPPGCTAVGAIPCTRRQDVAISSDGSSVVIGQFNVGSLLRLNAAALNGTPVEILTSVGHHGVALSPADGQTILATVAASSDLPGSGVTVASLSSNSVLTTLPTPTVAGVPSVGESVAVNCAGTRAVVELSQTIVISGGATIASPGGAGLMWVDVSTPAAPIVLSNSFGTSRADAITTSTVAFSPDGNLLFVGGGERPLTQGAVDVYDATTDPPTFKTTLSASQVPNANVATAACASGPTPTMLLIDQETLNKDLPSIQQISNNPPSCGAGDPAVCVNDDIAVAGERTPLFTRGNDITPFAPIILPTPSITDVGIFKFANGIDLQTSNQNGATFTIQEFFTASGAAADPNNLDKIDQVAPLNAAEIISLNGKRICAVIF